MTSILEWMAESLHPGLTQWIQYMLGKQYLYRVFFFTGPPPKSSKYGKVDLGKARCI